jgi:Mg-chelatase subunit ChlD
MQSEDRARTATEDAKRLSTKLEELTKRADGMAGQLQVADQAVRALRTDANALEEKARLSAESAEFAARQAKSSDTAAREAQAAMDGLKAELQSTGEIRRELLGIPGRVTNTVFVIDRSESMQLGDRWEDAKRTIAAWIRYLPVARASMVVFGSDMRVLPMTSDSKAGRALDSAELPELTQPTRDRLVEEMSALAPAGQTRTAEALRRAMEFADVDCIILFTDGTPDASGDGPTSNPRQEVIDLVASWKASHPNSRVHTVGIGDYFKAPMRDFLLGVARAGDGAFIGR